MFKLCAFFGLLASLIQSLKGSIVKIVADDVDYLFCDKLSIHLQLISDLIIIQHNDLAVNMMENCQYEHILIDHYIKLVFDKCQQEPKQSDIIRLPFNIYVQTKKIFKQENQIISYLIKRITEIFYLKEYANEESNSNDEIRNVYLRLIFSLKSNKVVIMSQIIVRIVLLALSIHIGQKDAKTFKFKFSRLIQDLKIQVILSPQSISDLIIKELQFMGQCFQSLQYYQELKIIFQKLQVNKIVKWLHSVMEKKRSTYQNKTQTTLPYKQESSNKISPKQQSLNGTEQITSIDSKIVEQARVAQVKGNSQIKNNKRQQRASSPKNQKRISTIVLANKLRQSIGVPNTRFSTKYTFKSSKKQSQQSIVVYQQETQIECLSTDKNQTSIFEKKSVMQNKVCFRNEQEDGNLILCPATPPKKNRKFILE